MHTVFVLQGSAAAVVADFILRLGQLIIVDNPKKY